MGLGAIDVLARVPLFAGLPDDERRRLAVLFHARQYARGEVIFLEGDEGTALCLIAEGRVRIQLTGADGREITINAYRPGEIFGELALRDGEPRSADAIAQEASRVFWLQRDDFAAFLHRHPRAALTMMASPSRRLRNTLRDVPARLARVLLDLSEQHGRRVTDGVRIDARLTQGELAALVGASRETVNRAIRGFEQQGVVRWASGQVTITQSGRLRARAEKT